MIMTRFLGFVRTIVFVFVFVFVFAERSAFGELELLSELTGREEVVKWAGYGEEKLSTVVVGGKILCHGADEKERTSIHPYPVSGAKVAVLCGGASGKTKSTANGSTDSSGNFWIDVPSHLHAIPNLEKVCCVKVVDLPRTCRCRRSRAGRHKAIKLSSIDQGIRTYTAHHIHLMPK